MKICEETNLPCENHCLLTQCLKEDEKIKQRMRKFKNVEDEYIGPSTAFGDEYMDSGSDYAGIPDAYNDDF